MVNTIVTTEKIVVNVSYCVKFLEIEANMAHIIINVPITKMTRSRATKLFFSSLIFFSFNFKNLIINKF